MFSINQHREILFESAGPLGYPPVSVRGTTYSSEAGWRLLCKTLMPAEVPTLERALAEAEDEQQRRFEREREEEDRAAARNEPDPLAEHYAQLVRDTNALAEYEASPSGQRERLIRETSRLADAIEKQKK